MNITELRLPRSLLLITLAGLNALLAACDEKPKPAPAPPVQLLASDVHVEIGGARLTLPFAALDDYAYRRVSFSFDREGDQKRQKEAVDEFIRSTGDPDRPLILRDLSIVIREYGSNASDTRQRQMCRLLTRAWSRSVCNNHWAAVRQALPADRFKLVDLRRLSEAGADQMLNCVKGSNPLLSIPKASGETALVCRMVLNSDASEKAVIRLDGDLGALWTVSSWGQNGEDAEKRAHREGKAIASFFKNGIGSVENFPALHRDMCRLRRPGSVDYPERADC